MTFDEFDQFLAQIPERVMPEAAEIVAETATAYFKETFMLKEWDGTPWTPAKVPKKTGSLLVESGNMMNSIRPAVIQPTKVVISAGNEKVDYARVHNEGFTGNVVVPAHTRQTKNGSVDVENHTRNVRIPQRQFMGKADELLDMIKERIVEHINKL
jgi:phage gpG-like protein